MSSESIQVNEEWESRLIDYSLGVLDAEAARQFELELEESRARVLLAEEYGSVVSAIGFATMPAEPPLGHKDRLLARIAGATRADTAESGDDVLAQTRPLQIVQPPERSAPTQSPRERGGVLDLTAYRERRSRAILPALASMAAALALLLGVWGFVQKGQLDEANTRLAQSSQILSVPTGYIGVPVQGQEGSKEASGVILLNPKTKEASILLSGLKPLPADKVYEMWLLPPGEGAAPVPVGTFNAEAGGTARQHVEAPSALDQYAAVAVSIEQAPGGTSPKGTIVLVGKYATP